MRTPDTICGNCGKTLNAIAHVSDDDPKPGPGDHTVCLYCDTVLTLNEDMTLRKATDEEVEELLTEPEFIQTLEFAEAFRKYKAKNAI